ncbi:cytochrome P450 [Aspergillus arachidicola]|uniref:Cytochrome P450 n=1 Tax=Aspergillus arachidicola TaxID=656916 RepID=A0A2G7FR17_9EURO|nr:cytochrome P450 [Aspergillus arachidicola]
MQAVALLRHVPLFTYVTAVPVALLAYVLAICIYRIWFHPLAKYPGPLLAKVTNLYGGYYAWKGDLHIDMMRCHEKYGNYVRYAPNRVLFNTNTGLKEIYAYSKSFQKSAAYGAMVHRAPNTLTLIDKKQHGRKRRIIGQGFGDAALRGFEGTIMSLVRKFCDELAKDISGGKVGEWSSPQNMGKWSNYLTFDIMSSIIFGESFDLIGSPKNREIVKCIEDSNVRTGVLSQAGELSTRRLDRWLFPQAIQGRNAFIRFVNILLKKRMSAKPLKRHDAFSFLLDAVDPETQQGFTPAEIGAESTTMIVAGSDTSSTAIASTFFYLCRNREWYEKAKEEVRAAFPGPDDVALGPALNNCVILRACIDESLRMSPPASSSLWREVLDHGVTIDGRVVPRGYDVGTCIYAIQHNPDYYPEPFEYRPDRWLDPVPEKVQLARSAFSPFSIGPRSCLGKGLAWTELMLTMAYMLSKYEFRSALGEDEKVGGGDEAMGAGRQREGEYQLRDHVTAAKDGPIVQVSFR